MMYLRWLARAPVSFAFNVFVMVTSPIWAVWAAALKLKALPGVFAMVHTHDDWIYGSGWPKPHVPPSFSKRFKTAVWWLCRNPGYGFDARVLGYPGPLKIETRRAYGTFDSGKSAAHILRMTTAKGVRLFCYRRDLALGGGRYCKIFLGWQPAEQAGWHIIKVSINPFRTA